MKVHLVDGTYELFRAFYGVPSAVSETGREVGAARGFVRSLLSLVRDPDVTHVAVAFDHVIESFRNELFDGYKTGDGIDPALWQQFELVERAAEALGFCVWPMVEFEADDALATAAHRFRDDPSVEQVVLCTPDKDLAQCVSGDRVVLWDRRRERVLDEDGVCEKYGVPPASIADWLALVGDTADGIPGIPRWGAKSAARVLAVYGSIAAIPEDASSWTVAVRGAAGLAEQLNPRRSEAELYRTLAELRVDVPLKEGLGDLAWAGADRAAVAALAAELSDERLPTRVPRFA